MKSYIYQQIKERITMADVLEHYGLEVKKGFAPCPFHSEKTSSLKVYSDNFYCYGCGTAGDLIKFVALLLNVENHEAVRIINDEFSLGLGIDGTTDSSAAKEYARKKKEQEELKAFYERTSNTLNSYYHFLYQQRQHPDDKNPLFFLSLRDLDRVEYLIQCLTENPAKFKNTYMKEVLKIERVLNKARSQCTM